MSSYGWHEKLASVLLGGVRSVVEGECLTLLTYSELGFRGTFPGSYFRGISIGCIVVQTCFTAS